MKQRETVRDSVTRQCDDHAIAEGVITLEKIEWEDFTVQHHNVGSRGGQSGDTTHCFALLDRSAAAEQDDWVLVQVSCMKESLLFSLTMNSASLSLLCTRAC